MSQFNKLLNLPMFCCSRLFKIGRVFFQLLIQVMFFITRMDQMWWKQTRKNDLPKCCQHEKKLFLLLFIGWWVDPRSFLTSNQSFESWKWHSEAKKSTIYDCCPSNFLSVKFQFIFWNTCGQLIVILHQMRNSRQHEILTFTLIYCKNRNEQVNFLSIFSKNIENQWNHS